MKETKTKFPVPINRQTLPLVVVPILLGILVVSLKQFQPIDQAILMVVAKLPRGATGLMTAASNVGTSGILIAVAVIWASVELFLKRPDRALVMMSSLIALPVYAVVKLAVHRARPVTDFVAKAGLHGESFPSGHSAGSFAVYCTLAYLVYRQLPSPWSKIGASLAVGLAVLIGFSRVYLGAHFPTDVIGGWLIASFILLLIRLVLVKYESRKSVSTTV